MNKPATPPETSIDKIFYKWGDVFRSPSMNDAPAPIEPQVEIPELQGPTESIWDALQRHHQLLEAALRDKTAAEQERDELLTALGWKVGSMDRAKEIILDDARKLRPELIKARRQREDAESDAFLWVCLKEDRPGLLNEVWKQKKAAESALRAANQRADEAFEAAAIRVAVMGGYYGLDEAQTDALVDEIKACSLSAKLSHRKEHDEQASYPTN